MGSLPFSDVSFDLLWSEGALTIIGFDTGLAAWRRLLRPGRYVVVTEASWFRDDASGELSQFLAQGYPCMRSGEANAAAAKAARWEVVATYPVPEEAWTEGYHARLRKRRVEFRRGHAGDEEALGVASMTECEMELFETYSDYYGHAFYVLRQGRSGSVLFCEFTSPMRPRRILPTRRQADEAVFQRPGPGVGAEGVVYGTT